MLVSKGTKVIYENENGGRIEFSPFSVYFLESFEEETKNQIYTNKTNLIHGETFVSNTLESRFITISTFIEKNKNAKEISSMLTKVMNPTLKGKLLYYNESEEKEISCIVESIPFFQNVNGILRCEIGLVAHNPFWKQKEKVEQLALFTPKLAFPLQFNGVIFGLKKSSLEVEVENIGDVNSGFRAVFKAKNGTVKNPKIYNKLTGDFIKINYQMAKGDSIEVLNYPEEKRITINSIENGFKHLDIESDFFQLLVGKNIIGYLADENTINLDVIMYYTPRYLGV